MNDLIKENRDKVNREIDEFWRIQNEIEDDFTSLAVKLREADDAIGAVLPGSMRDDWDRSIKYMKDDLKPLRLRMEALDTAIMLLKFTEFALANKEQ